MCNYHPSYSWTCTACQHSGQVTVHYPEERWTDSECPEELAGVDFETPTIMRCPSCSLLQRAGELKWTLGEEQLPELDPPSEADYLSALEAGLYETRFEKLDLRLRAWRAGNDPSRVEGARAQIRSAEAQANLEALFDLLCDDPAEALTKAEVARQLGRFERARELIGGLSRLARVRQPARTIARLAGAGSDAVAKVSWEEDLSLRYTCPHCLRPGRVSESGAWADSRYEFDSQLTLEHALRCGSCRGVLWRGDQSRTKSFALETFSDGAVAELGCCLFFPLALAVAVFSPPAGGAVIASYFLLILATEIGSVVRRRVYPDSLPLRDGDFEALLEAQDWSGAEEERWVRLSVFYARTQGRSQRCGLDANAVALLGLVGDTSGELWLEARVRRRAGDLAGAREVAERLQASDDEWYAKRGAALLQNLERPDASG